MGQPAGFESPRLNNAKLREADDSRKGAWTDDLADMSWPIFDNRNLVASRRDLTLCKYKESVHVIGFRREPGEL